MTKMDSADHRTRTGASLSAEDVYQVLRNEILMLQLSPGEHFSENAISSRFNLSRTPVRAVISRLAQEGLVVQQGRKGNYVNYIDLDMAENMIYMRVQMECAVMRHIALNPNAMLFRMLEDNLEDQKRVIEGKLDKSDFYRVDSEFHEMCMENAGRLRLWRLTQMLDVHYSRYRRLDYYAFQKDHVFEALYHEHAELLEVMRGKRAADVRWAVTSHLYSGMIRIGNKLYDTYTDYFLPGSRSLDEILRGVRLTLNEARAE